MTKSSRHKIPAAAGSARLRPRRGRGRAKKRDLKIDTGKRAVIRRCRSAIRLSRKEFLLFAELFKRSPGTVSFRECFRVLSYKPSGAAMDAATMLVCRLRRRLGQQLARRIKSKRRLGWMYVQPRFRPRRAEDMRGRYRGAGAWGLRRERRRRQKAVKRRTGGV